MEYINGIHEVLNPVLIVIPIVLMALSGFSIGRIISKVRKTDMSVLDELIFGNLSLIFLFIIGFIIFGVLTYQIKNYFTAFTFSLVILAILSCYFLIQKAILNYKNSSIFSSPTNIFVIFGIVLFIILISYHGLIIYYHPIFEEYDAIYNYLLTSKSILLGNGLHHDFYRGLDIPSRSPPLDNAINAWLMDVFGYSSFRLFPVYFVFLSSLFVYRFSQKITNNSYLGWLAAAVFFITPSTLVISSRFTLSNDLSFILLLTASFYFLVEIISQRKVSRFYLLMLIISLSNASLSKELGIIITFTIILLIFSTKFTKENIKLRIMLNVLSISPFYVLSLYDFYNYGLMPLTIIRFVSIILANVGLYYLLSKIKSEEKFSYIFRHIPYFIPLIPPMIFVLINIFTIHGPYPIMIFSDTANKSMESFRSLFGIENKILLDLPHALEKIPRIDILFSATALGSLFIFFKMRGFVVLLRDFKNNSQYCALLVAFVLLLITWSYFDLGFEASNIRHIGYFAPIFSVIFVLSLKKMNSRYKVFYYGLLVFSAYYFLSHNIQILNRNDHFEAFWIDPYKTSIISLLDIEVAAALILSLLVFESEEDRIIQFFNKKNLQKVFSKPLFLIIAILFVLAGTGSYALASSNIMLTPLNQIDTEPLGKWENDVFDVINYLNKAENGNVISLQAPAISFFTNRTNFELYDPHVFALVSPILETSDPEMLKERISKMNIRYIVIPSENSLLTNKTENIKENFNIIKIIENDPDFLKIDLKSYTLYKFVGTTGINLIDENHKWIPFYHTEVNQTNQTLSILVKTDETRQIANRAYLETTLVSHPLLLSLAYESESKNGNAVFYTEIDDKTSGKMIWSSVLDNTEGKQTRHTFQLPDNISDRPILLKMFIITNGPGEHLLTVQEARIVHT